jgi:hypothetical protein
MQKTTIQFATLGDLVQFQKAVGMSSYRINASAVSLTGQFSATDILLAEVEFNGKALQTEPALQEVECLF